jgi:hypothetical protein
MIKQACGAALLLCPLLAGAADGDASAWQFGGGFGVTMGGDELGTVHVFRNGELAQSENIRAGRLFQVDAGVRLRPANSPLMLQMTFGYHYDSTNGKDLATGTKDVSAYFVRYPLEVLPSIRFDRHSLGVGLRYDFAPTLGASDDTSFKFKDAAGGIVEYGYSPNQQVTFGLRFVKIKYKPHDTSFDSVDGDHYGVNAKFWF